MPWIQKNRHLRPLQEDKITQPDQQRLVRCCPPSPACVRLFIKSSTDDFKNPRLWRGALAEFLGTFFLVFLGCGTCVGGGGVSWQKVEPNILQISLTFGFVVATSVWCVSHVSGSGHINPAVSLGMFFTGKISLASALIYIAAQTVGGVAGAGVMFGVTPALKRSNLGNTEVNDEVLIGQAFVVEFVITFILVFTVFASCDVNRKTARGCPAISIGIIVTACHLFAIKYTGSGMNPARSFGPALLMNSWENHWIYWIAPLAGGVASALSYELLFAADVTLQKPAKWLQGLSGQRLALPKPVDLIPLGNINLPLHHIAHHSEGIQTIFSSDTATSANTDHICCAPELNPTASVNLAFTNTTADVVEDPTAYMPMVDFNIPGSVCIDNIPEDIGHTTYWTDPESMPNSSTTDLCMHSENASASVNLAFTNCTAEVSENATADTPMIDISMPTGAAHTYEDMQTTYSTTDFGMHPENPTSSANLAFTNCTAEVSPIVDVSIPAPGVAHTNQNIQTTHWPNSDSTNVELCMSLDNPISSMNLAPEKGTTYDLSTPQAPILSAGPDPNLHRIHPPPT